jgi:predicted dehydrogenase
LSRPRLGLIGAGRWGEVYLRTLAEMTDACELAVLATRTHARRAALYPAPLAITADYRDLLRAELDGVIVAVPPRLHPEILEAALRAGKAVMIEKPLCLDVPAAERMVAAVARSGLPVLVNHVHLFGAPYRALKRELELHGERPRLVVAEGGALGPFRADWSALWDWLPHDAALVLDLFGELPTQVSSLAGPDPDRPENWAVRLSWADGGSAWIHSGSLLPSRRRVLSVGTDRHLYVVDERAQDALTVRDFSYEDRSRDDDVARDPRSVPLDDGAAPLTRALRTFIDAIRGGSPTGLGVGLARDVVELIARIEDGLPR